MGKCAGVAVGELVSVAMKEGDSLGYGPPNGFSLWFKEEVSVGVAMGG